MDELHKVILIDSEIEGLEELERLSKMAESLSSQLAETVEEMCSIRLAISVFPCSR